MKKETKREKQAKAILISLSPAQLNPNPGRLIGKKNKKLSTKDRRKSGWVTPNIHKGGMSFNEMKMLALEPQPIYDDWQNYRDGMRDGWCEWFVELIEKEKKISKKNMVNKNDYKCKIHGHSSLYQTMGGEIICAFCENLVMQEAVKLYAKSEGLELTKEEQKKIKEYTILNKKRFVVKNNEENSNSKL